MPAVSAPRRKLALIAVLGLVLLAPAIVVWRSLGRGMGSLSGGLTARDLNLVVVTLDTTRADRLGCYGYSGVRTPHLDALARAGALFEQAHAPVPLTLPSHSSLFTARYPPEHGVRDNGGYFLPESETTLAEVLKEHGFDTGGFISAYVLDRRWGIAQGFDRYYDDFDLSRYRTVSMSDIQRRGDETVGRALEWIGGREGRRFFAWVHLYDPHSPYEPPEPYATAYAGKPYLGEVAWTDSLVGELVEGLSRSGLLDRTLLIVTADHGESLGEHSESGHAFFVYGVSTHVPLIVAGPWPRLAGRRIPDVVRTIDIMPTVLDLLAVPDPGERQGRSLVPLLEGRTIRGAPPAYSESFYPRYHFGWSDLRTLRTSTHRFIEAPRPELYDVVSDPGETDNLAGGMPLVVERMREELAEAEALMTPAAPGAAPAVMDEESQRKLAALGYIGSTVDTAGKASRDLPDPKDKIDIVNRMHQAREDFLAGRITESIQALRGVTADAPEVIDAWFRLGNACLRAGDLPAALEMFRRTLVLKPDHDWAVVGMADTYVEMGRIDEALVGYRRFLERDPANENVAYRLGETLLDAGRLDEAAAAFRRVLEINPRRASAAVGLAATALRSGDAAAAVEQARRALAIDPAVKHAHYNLALALERAGDRRAAAGEYRNEIDRHPHASKARFNLARLLAAVGDHAGEIRELRAAIEDNPGFSVGRYFLAKALLDSGDLGAAESEAKEALRLDPEAYHAPLGHYVLADVWSRQGRHAEAAEEARAGRRLETRNLPPPS